RVSTNPLVSEIAVIRQLGEIEDSFRSCLSDSVPVRQSQPSKSFVRLHSSRSWSRRKAEVNWPSSGNASNVWFPGRMALIVKSPFLLSADPISKRVTLLRDRCIVLPSTTSYFLRKEAHGQLFCGRST